MTSSILNSTSDNSWAQDPDFRKYSTAMDTRSLSISLIPDASNSSDLNASKNSTTNVALLYYENPNGKVSALLHRHLELFAEDPAAGSSSQEQWIDITSQESKALAKEFRNAPGFNYSNTLYKTYNDTTPTMFSHTLYEADPTAVYGTPFFSAPGFFAASVGAPGFFSASVGAIFYSPFSLPLNTLSPPAGDSFFFTSYAVDLNGSGNFSLAGMNYAAPCTECFREVTFISASTPPSKEYTSIHRSDIAGFGWDHAIWINGTQPALIRLEYTDDATLPSSEFPFTRLASVTSTDGSATYLYHQINDTTFAEEQWDFKLRGWLHTEYITVSDS